MPHRPVKRAPDNITFAEIEKIASNQSACLALFERLRFPDGLHCVACGATEAAGASFTRHRTRPGLFTCGGCRRQFTLTSDTAMHRTRLPLGQWLRAIWLIVSSSKGVSARKLSEMLGIIYKVAWHLGHRIRTMIIDESIVLSGIVEMVRDLRRRTATQEARLRTKWCEVWTWPATPACAHNGRARWTHCI